MLHQTGVKNPPWDCGAQYAMGKLNNDLPVMKPKHFRMSWLLSCNKKRNWKHRCLRLSNSFYSTHPLPPLTSEDKGPITGTTATERGGQSGRARGARKSERRRRCCHGGGKHWAETVKCLGERNACNCNIYRLM